MKQHLQKNVYTNWIRTSFEVSAPCSGTLRLTANQTERKIGATFVVPYRLRAMTNRLDVRLDSEHRRRLEELAGESGVPISEIVRRLIDGAYEDIVRARRKQAIERLIGLNVEDPPEPDTLSRELEAAHEPGGLH